MNDLQATAVMIGLFALRCILPLVLTAAFLQLMNRLLDQWADEERATGSGAAAAPAASAHGLSVPIATATQEPSIACWLLRNCDEARRSTCAAYNRQDIPCWQARLLDEGKLPDDCVYCPQYTALQGAI